MKKVVIACILMIILVSCKKSPNNPQMEEEINSVQPVIVKKLEANYIANTKEKDQIQIIFIKSLSKDSNEYVVKGLYNAIKNYLRENTTLTDKEYIILSNELVPIANTQDSKLKFSINGSKKLILDSPELRTMSMTFNKSE